MTNVNKDHNDEWKRELHTLLITSVINGQNTDESITERVGYYYMYYAPAFLYKYYGDSSRVLNNLKTNKIWFSAPCNFNDVFDCDIKVEDKKVFQSVLRMVPNSREVRKGSPLWITIKQTVDKELHTLKRVFEELKLTMGISCFSESYDSLLMWAHYANNHRGMCVEYELLEINKQLGFSPVPIIYSNERISFSAISPDTIEADTMSIFMKSILSKSPEWSYENEWRIIQDCGACGDNWNKEERGALRNMIYPKSIILGCMATKDFEDEVRVYCEDNKINLYKMSKNKDLYKVDKIPLLQFD